MLRSHEVQRSLFSLGQIRITFGQIACWSGLKRKEIGAILGRTPKRSTFPDLLTDRLLGAILFETRLKLRAQGLVGGQEGKRF